jgi:hypothetical protein
MYIDPGDKVGTATLITGLRYVGLFRCECGKVFTASKTRVDNAIYGKQMPYCKPTPPIPLKCPSCLTFSQEELTCQGKN